MTIEPLTLSETQPILAPALAHVIVTGNEKGGAGKSTVAMHIALALTRMGRRVGVIDLDVRQRTLTRYLENRRAWAQMRSASLTSPTLGRITPSALRNIDEAEAEEAERFDQELAELSRACQFVVIDAPASDTHLSRLAHAAADTLISPINDSFVDFDLLGDVDPETFAVRRPSFYSELVWECRKRKAQRMRRPIDWIVIRNRTPTGIDSRNSKRLADALKALSTRIGFRIGPGLAERVIFRELFPKGLTLLDLDTSGIEHGMQSIAHISARQEVRDLMIVLKLPGLDGEPLRF
jgi:chromosome partitioning protein